MPNTIALMGVGKPGRSTLLNNLVAFWKLDEASGNRSDCIGSNTLTDNNTVGQTTGPTGNVAQFENTSSEYLSCANNSDLQTGDIDFTFAFWVYFDERDSALYLISRRNYSSPLEYVVRLNYANNHITWRVYGASDALVGDVESSGVMSTGTWYCVVVWHDAANNQVGISVNDGTATTASTTGAVTAKTVTLALGGISDSGYYHHGRMGAVGFWKRVLTAAERTDFYNSGNGKVPPFS